MNSKAISISLGAPESRIVWVLIVCASASSLSSARFALETARGGGRGNLPREKGLPPERGELASLNCMDFDAFGLGSGICKDSSVICSMTFTRAVRGDTDREGLSGAEEGLARIGEV